MSKTLTVVISQSIMAISTDKHPIVYTNTGCKQCYNFNLDLCKHIPYAHLDSGKLLCIKTGKPLMHFKLTYTGKTWPTKKSMQTAIKNYTGNLYNILAYDFGQQKITNNNTITFNVYAVDANDIEPYTLSEKDQKRLQRKQTCKARNNIRDTFIVRPLDQALKQLDSRLWVSVCCGCPIIRITDYSLSYVKLAKYYETELKDDILKILKGVGLDNITDCKNNPFNFYGTLNLIKIRKVNIKE